MARRFYRANILSTMLKPIPISWVSDANKLLQAELPTSVQQDILYPDANFYAQYDLTLNKTAGLHLMARALFDWLQIDPMGCIIDFYEEKVFPKHAGDTAGFYTSVEDKDGYERELIYINSKRRQNALAVGAILAHEMMHLYLFRLNLRLENTRENELLTDLATVTTGLAILILNGMYYQSYRWLTIILLLVRIYYRRTEQKSFGYFQPKAYGAHVRTYLRAKGLGPTDVIGHVNPSSRRFLPHYPLLRGKATTEYIQQLNRRYWCFTTLKYIPAAIIAGFVIIAAIQGNQQDAMTSELRTQVDSCKATVNTLAGKVNKDQTNLDDMDARMTQYQKKGQTRSYNDLVDPYNSLLAQIMQEIADYDTQRTRCNKLIDQYNANQ